MKKYFTLIGAVALIMALTVSPAFAAGQQSSMPGQSTQSQFNQRQMQQRQAQMGQQGQLQNAFLANELMDKKVISAMRQDEKLGTVHNLVVSPDGQINYILLEPERGMKESGQLIAIPWDVAHPTVRENQVEVFLSKQQLQNAPTVAKNNLAQLQNPRWQQENFAYFGMGYMPQQRMPQQGYGMPQQGMPQGQRMMPRQGYGNQGYNY